jgi:hypothetical protein
LICLLIIFTILIAGLWPFNFLPPNKVRWLPDRSGVKIYGQGIIFTPHPGWSQEKSLFPDRAITIELWLHPHQETSHLPSILTFYDGHNPDIFLLGQWKSHLVIRSRTLGNENRKPGKVYQEIGLRNGLRKNQDVFITVTSKKEGSAIYVNGRLAEDYPRYRLLAGMTSGNIRLIVGNSPAGQGYWPGDILGMAVYRRALTPDEVAGNHLSWIQNDPYAVRKERSLIGLYLFYEREGKLIRNAVNPDDTLTIPDIFKPVRKVVLSPPWQSDLKWNGSFFQDMAINIVGFIPVGFFFSALLLTQTNRRRMTLYVMAVAIGMGLSLVVELTQAYLPARDSSLTDWLNNSLGTMLGVFIFPALRLCRNRENVISEECLSSVEITEK